ncbi:MAG: hypothetical protein LAP38_23785 [Acidobacteriia bacterium]|nr:hypothetical protein [Terriglobia bacterium]
MLKGAVAMAVTLGCLGSPLLAQDANSGISVPVTVSGGAMYTGRLQLADPDESALAGGLRAMLYPSIRLGSHWFGYAALQVRLTPYFYYDAYDPEREWYIETLQAFVGYSWRNDKTSWVVKAGRLSTAFGSYALRYDDAENPVLDQPLSYVQTLTLRTDQLPCGVNDLAAQHYGSISNRCGGVPGRDRGLTPVTLYGLPGIQAEVSSHRVDARFQVTNGSPASPQGWDRAGQYVQWTAGGGYTIRQGFRIGASGFRGPYLDHSLTPLLPAGTSARDFPASALGVDAQWARGRWSATGEWQRFWFASPNFTVAPSLDSTYVEVKSVITPRFFLAGRAGWLNSRRVVDKQEVSAAEFAPSIASYEMAAGSWLNRHQLLKASYEWLKIQPLTGTRFNVVGFQLVTTFHAVDWAFH